MSKLLGVLLVLLSLLSTPAWAAIAYVSNTESANTLSTTTVTTAVTVSAGADRVLWVAAQAVRSGGVFPAAISGITFNGSESFTFVKTNTINASFASRVELWCLVAPTVTTGNVVATYADNGTDRVQAYSVLYFTGANQFGENYDTVIRQMSVGAQYLFNGNEGQHALMVLSDRISGLGPKAEALGVKFLADLAHLQSQGG